MTITHQTVVDSLGKPSAALIPWSEFLLSQEILERVKSPLRKLPLSVKPKLTVGVATAMSSPILPHQKPSSLSEMRRIVQHRRAVKSLRGMPLDRQVQIVQALEEIAAVQNLREHPHTKARSGEFAGWFRLPTGVYRSIVQPSPRASNLTPSSAPASPRLRVSAFRFIPSSKPHRPSSASLSDLRASAVQILPI
jgi:mRNA-degrading endonuclease RelE of RelBE toxin-antitoxin system